MACRSTFLTSTVNQSRERSDRAFGPIPSVVYVFRATAEVPVLPRIAFTDEFEQLTEDDNTSCAAPSNCSQSRFDPRRVAILLIGGDKTGNDRLYEEFVPMADKIYAEHLREMEKGDQ